MVKFGLLMGEYAEAMADSFAWMLWVGKMDGEGVDYVLGPCRESTLLAPLLGLGPIPAHGDSCFDAPLIGLHALWVLDFDLCQRLDMTKEGMNKAADAFWRNNPFYPRPVHPPSAEQGLWKPFVVRFMATSEVLLSEEGKNDRQLPKVLIHEIIRRAHV